MYKLFLTFRYLTRKAIVIFPILVVWLCVMMMIIVSSIMGGFVDRVREANRGLMGDVIIESSRNGFPHYDELQKKLEALPEVELTTPVIHAYGLINFPDLRANTFAQIVGIDPAQRAKISQFRQSLFRQYTVPREAAEDLRGITFPATGFDIQKYANDRWDAADQAVQEATKASNALSTDAAALTQLDRTAHGFWVFGAMLFIAAFVICLSAIFGRRRWYALLAALALTLSLAGILQLLVTFNFIGQRLMLGTLAGAFVLATLLLTFAAFAFSRRFIAVTSTILIAITAGLMITGVLTERKAERLDDRSVEAIRANDRADRTFRTVMSLDAKRVFKTYRELVAAITPPEPTFTPPPSAATRYGDPANAPKYGCIVGVDLGLYDRDKNGNYNRQPFTENIKTILTVVPISAKGNAQFTDPQEETFTVVDDAYTRVFDVDSTYVYAPFDVVQRMTLMAGQTDADGNPLPPRASEIQIKVRGSDDPETLDKANDKINAVLDKFRDEYHDLSIFSLPRAETWEDKQAKYIKAVQNEKFMLTFILGLMSVVVLVVIFLIFYMIVRDKTRDIGIIKALGGSEEGVATIFLLYGLFIGTVGGAMGTICGIVFVHHTNWIHDKVLYNIFGITIWDRSVYLFDRIPDQVNPKECFLYLLSAIIAGGIGALLPAILAGSQDPVRAVRYE
jgi:ABC-type lipoprotein release transport system permease subunit